MSWPHFPPHFTKEIYLQVIIPQLFMLFSLQDLNLGDYDSNVVLLSNPGTIKINEVHIGVSTQDILFHMISQDVSRYHIIETL